MDRGADQEERLVTISTDGRVTQWATTKVSDHCLARWGSALWVIVYAVVTFQHEACCTRAAIVLRSVVGCVYLSVPQYEALVEGMLSNFARL